LTYIIRYDKHISNCDIWEVSIKWWFFSICWNRSL